MYVKRSGRETMVAVRVWWRHGHQRCVDMVCFRSVWSVWCGLCPSPHPSPPPVRRSCLICHLKSGDTGLHWASKMGKLASLEALLDDFGANIEAKDKVR